ncbi:Lp29 family lipoprotein [Leptospira barantonii]|uniref:Lipoprotein n=1 Tax=Leptospira barantonii TaxID=2023184 RepID=A0ABX4NHJ0_9LEPT|nr:hypothetical protein [Leptospira barantonii]PJZ55799.1 hypothetical protein CH367_18185 [Leptospira barantonii]
MKIFIIILQFTILLSCSRNFVRPAKVADLNSIINKIDPKKVALVGFYPFREVFTGREGNTSHYEAILNYQQDFKIHLKEFGTPIQNIKETGMNHGVSKTKVNEFCSNYMELVKRSGLPEISHVVKIKVNAEGSKTTYDCELKKRDVKYYVVGILGPPFYKTGKLNPIKAYPTLLLALPTLFTIPLWAESDTETTILVYDENLNLLKRWEDVSTYQITFAWWNPAREGEGNEFTQPTEAERNKREANKIELYQPMLTEFQQEFYTSITQTKK